MTRINFNCQHLYIVRGWLVVLASFLCVAIVDGVGYTTGLMLERFSFLTHASKVVFVLQKDLNSHLAPLFSLKSELGGSRGAVAVVGSLQVLSHHSIYILIFTQVGVYSLSGPIVGKLVSRFGPRAVCISGAIVARSDQKENFLNFPTRIFFFQPSCGLLASSFAPSLTMVYSSYGLVTGFGFGAM